MKLCCRVQEANMSEIGVSDVVADQPLLTDASNHIVDNTSENIPSTPDNLVDNDTTDCTTLIPLSAVRMEPLAVVPINQKNKRSELSQRRIRRPFSVTEVEALVHAIEELGTGRLVWSRESHFLRIIRSELFSDVPDLSGGVM